MKGLDLKVPDESRLFDELGWNLYYQCRNFFHTAKPGGTREGAMCERLFCITDLRGERGTRKAG
jgi:hypothetical protein